MQRAQGQHENLHWHSWRLILLRQPSRVGFPTAWASPASSTCRPNGPASTKCLAFPPNSRAFEPRLFELKSLFPGNGISWTETKAPKQARKFEDAFAETGPRKEAGQFGASAENREISVSVGVRGGPGRTRTVNQIVMKWSRRSPSAAWLGAYATAPGDFFGHSADTKTHPQTSACASITSA